MSLQGKPLVRPVAALDCPIECRAESCERGDASPNIANPSDRRVCGVVGTGPRESRITREPLPTFPEGRVYGN